MSTERLSKADVDAARLIIVNHVLERSCRADTLEAAKRSIREAFEITGREAVFISEFMKNQIELDLGEPE